MYTKKPVEQSSYPQPRSHLGYTEGRLISLLHVHTSPITINTIISHSTTHKIIEPRNTGSRFMKNTLFIIYQCRNQRENHRFQQRKQDEEHRDFPMKVRNTP